MINDLDVNNKVTTILVQIKDENPINYEIMMKMVNKYRNIYWIVVYDWSDLVDN